MNITLNITNTHSKAVLALMVADSTLLVTYSNKRTYAYKGVDKATVAGLLAEVANNGSLGVWVNKKVKPFFAFEEVTA